MQSWHKYTCFRMLWSQCGASIEGVPHSRHLLTCANSPESPFDTADYLRVAVPCGEPVGLVACEDSGFSFDLEQKGFTAISNE